MVRGRNTRALGLRISDEAYEWFLKEAEKYGIAVGTLIRRLLENYVKRQKEE